jgi:transmembrane sensor
MTDERPVGSGMPEEEDHVWSLLDRYLSGECSAAEAEAVDRWAANPANARTLALVRRIWGEAASPAPSMDEEGELLALQARIAAARRSVPAPRLVLHRGAGSRSRWFVPALAAAAVIAVAAGVWRSGVVQRAIDARRVPERLYATARSQRSEVMLDDGTRVWLNVDSRLRALAGYGVHARDVVLDGEAFFQVQHDSTRPFRVHARHAVMQDLGTEFGVRAYADDDAPLVVVSSGSVSLRADEPTAAAHDAIALRPGQMGRLGADGRVSVTSGVDVAALVGWRSGRLRFAAEPLRQVVREMERAYDLDIRIEDSSLADVPVTASFANYSADQALAIVAGSLDVTCVREGQVVHLGGVARSRGAPCGAAARSNSSANPPAR